MTRVNLELPSSIHLRAKELAERDGVSLDQLVALAEKMSALDTVNYLKTRAARGSREQFEAALDKTPARRPFPTDEFPAEQVSE